MRTSAFTRVCTRLVLLVALTLAAAPAPQPSRPAAAGADTAGVPAVGRAWPVGVRPRVLRGWEPPATPYGRGHRGVDLAAAPGARVRAVAAGRVSFAGRVAGRGVVSLELDATGGPPLRTTYEPVHPSVTEGTKVRPGEVIATLAPTPTPSHCPTPCLHWGLLRSDTYLNPLALLPPHLLQKAPPRLLPVLGSPLRPTAGSRASPRA
ncbi:murein hydrolase activator EnvC family protein [Streptomyces edwardsiae]|uniref:murein hydrolase activator EnvC family protein n=1 Tax=Streptomyces edwardsiae TaxID=3075527 RepID=UPI0038732303